MAGSHFRMKIGEGGFREAKGPWGGGGGDELMGRAGGGYNGRLVQGVEPHSRVGKRASYAVSVFGGNP